MYICCHGNYSAEIFFLNAHNKNENRPTLGIFEESWSVELMSKH